MLSLLIAAAVAGVSPEVSLDVCENALEASPQTVQNYESAFDARARYYHLTQEQVLQVSDVCILLAFDRVNAALTELGRKLPPSNRH